MKKVLIWVIMCLMACGTATAQEYTKAERKEARKQAKDYIKKGYLVKPGCSSLEAQYLRLNAMKNKMDEEGYPLYIVGSSSTPGQNYDAARFQAIELAKGEIVRQMETNITSLVESKMGNEQRGPGAAVSVTNTVGAIVGRVSKKIGRVIVAFEAYRILPNGNTEVTIHVAYSSKKAQEIVDASVREVLEMEADALLEEIEQTNK